MIDFALTEWFGRLSAGGTRVLVGDPGRSYRPTERLEALATYEGGRHVQALEDSEVKNTTVWRFR